MSGRLQFAILYCNFGPKNGFVGGLQIRIEFDRYHHTIENILVGDHGTA